MAEHATYLWHPLSGYEPARLVPVLQTEEELRGLLIASLAGSAAALKPHCNARRGWMTAADGRIQGVG